MAARDDRISQADSIAGPGGRAARDRAHYDATAASLAAKDCFGPSAIARRHRHLRSLALAEAGHLGRVLELGCGCGFGARYLAGRYDAYLGIDHSAAVIDAAQALAPDPAARFERADAATWQTGERFDTVFMIGVLHHMPDPVGVLRNVLRAARPGALVIANEPQSTNPAISLARKFRARADGGYSEEQDEYSATLFAAVLRAAGLRDVRLRGQRLFSTPFAEIMLRPAALTAPLARAACAADLWLERRFPGVVERLGWNLVGSGRT